MIFFARIEKRSTVRGAGGSASSADTLRRSGRVRDNARRMCLLGACLKVNDFSFAVLVEYAHVDKVVFHIFRIKVYGEFRYAVRFKNRAGIFI